MKKLSKIFVFSIVLLYVCSCGTKKNTLINRKFHSLTTKYNVLFNGEQAFLKGLKEIEEKHQDNFWRRLPIEPITFNENVIEANETNHVLFLSHVGSLPDIFTFTVHVQHFVCMEVLP